MSLLMGLSSYRACLTEQTAWSELLLDCTVTRTIDAVFRIVFSCVCSCVCIRNGDLKQTFDRDCDF